MRYEADEDAAGQLSSDFFPLFEVLWVLEYQYQGIARSAAILRYPLKTAGSD